LFGPSSLCWLSIAHPVSFAPSSSSGVGVFVGCFSLAGLGVGFAVFFPLLVGV